MHNQSHDTEKVYDLARWSTGNIVHCFPVGGRHVIDTCIGIPTVFPAPEDEFVATFHAFFGTAVWWGIR